MPELLYVQTPEFELSIWSNDISERQKVYLETLKKRSRDQLLTDNIFSKERASFIYLSPALQINSLKAEQGTIVKNQMEAISEIELPTYIFFENIQYQFEWIFCQRVSSAQLIHKSKLMNDAFRFIDAHRTIPARFIGTINTGNNVGWVTLPLEYYIDGQRFKHELSFEVLATKMDLHADLPVMYQEIDQVFPLWRFNLVEKTEQNAAKGKNRGNFPLMWLANFAQLREQFEQGLKVVVQAPHSRLQTYHTLIKADRVKGRVIHRTGLKIEEDRLNGQFEKRYKIEKKKLSVDTPENRFIKSVVITCRKKLVAFEKRFRSIDQVADRQRLSDNFLHELHQWQYSLNKILAHNFFDDVSVYTGLNKESLVLQQKTGYSKVYRIWQDLKFYLDKFGDQSTISVKSVAEIYEVWCFLTLKNILIDDLGFSEISVLGNKLILNGYFEYQLKDGFVGAFMFERADGVKVRLVHEPKFTKNGLDIRSYLVSQEPDIVLEIEFPNGEKFIWLFDAKYRIKTEEDRFGSENLKNTDYVPDDAINQMHRYRDALIRINAENEFLAEKKSKTRPVFGAFCLYPGYFNQKHTQNPYQNAIDEIGIGAFALLPNVLEDDNHGYYWLLKYLESQIGLLNVNKLDSNLLGKNIYLQEPARIPYHGMQQVLHADLIMVAPFFEGIGQDTKNYRDSFENGTAQWFYLPRNKLSVEYGKNISKEIRYLVVAILDNGNIETTQIEKIWPVMNVHVTEKYRITKGQVGSDSDSDEIYYLFELGQPLSLMNTISYASEEFSENKIKLTTLNELSNVKSISELGNIYLGVLD